MEKNRIKLHNTLTGKKETFRPIDDSDAPKIGMYVCGPTVYDRAHIGNARAVVVFDVLYRLLRHEYGERNVTYVRNITDVDDKINAAAKERGIDISELTTKTTEMFHNDMAALNCLLPDEEPRATDNIDGMIEMCETLIASGHAYAAEGHVLFSVESYEKYGHLSRRSRDEMVAGARVEIAPYKKNPADFVLWKPSKNDEPGWDSPWGRGRPGWHIECSVMSTKYLGETFDIHGGGADLKFPHHENEVAQSCCAFPGSEFARYWVHNGFLSVEGEKMSKSLGNFVTVKDLLESYESKDVDICIKYNPGAAIRLALLSSHYSKPLDWNEKAKYDAERSIIHFVGILNENKELFDDSSSLPDDFIKALRDDLNTPLAIAGLHSIGNIVRAKDEVAKKIAVNQLKAACDFLGIIDSKKIKNGEADVQTTAEEEAEIRQKINNYNAARAVKNYAESDRIRNELAADRITILSNHPDGTPNWKCG